MGMEVGVGIKVGMVMGVGEQASKWAGEGSLRGSGGRVRRLCMGRRQEGGRGRTELSWWDRLAGRLGWVRLLSALRPGEIDSTAAGSVPGQDRYSGRAATAL